MAVVVIATYDDVQDGGAVRRGALVAVVAAVAIPQRDRGVRIDAIPVVRVPLRSAFSAYGRGTLSDYEAGVSVAKDTAVSSEHGRVLDEHGSAVV